MTTVKILTMIKELISCNEFKERNKMNEKDFIRNRKMTFAKLIMFLMNLIRKSLQIEIDDFIDLLNEDMEYSKQALSKSRMKLKPEAFKELNEVLLKGKYEENNIKKYKGYRLLAIDGSTVELPRTKELLEKFGEMKTKNKEVKIVGARTSLLYDIENELIIDGTICKYKSSERDLAESHIDYYLKLKNSLKIQIKTCCYWIEDIRVFI